jgi:NADPH-dependent 2,4-dienoyl-CoA reductase/sulfur reductase-like enzyme
MRVQGAVIREQGQTFAVVIVKPCVVQNRTAADDAIAGLTPAFGVPVVIMAQDSRGRPTYYGRNDIARFLSNVPLRAIPWRQYDLKQLPR